MKKIKFFTVSFIIFSFVFMTNVVYAQAKKEVATSDFKIKVMFDCSKGKALIEKELIKEPGVKKVVADVATKIVTVSFDGTKTNRIIINEAIEKIGYQTELTSKDKKINNNCSKTCESQKQESKK